MCSCEALNLNIALKQCFMSGSYAVGAKEQKLLWFNLTIFQAIIKLIYCSLVLNVSCIFGELLNH